VPQRPGVTAPCAPKVICISYVELPLVIGGGVPTDPPSVQFQVPTNRNKLPMGYYMLFLVTNVGVPSVAQFVLVEP
jgi:hypothetical protein